MDIANGHSGITKKDLNDICDDLLEYWRKLV